MDLIAQQATEQGSKSTIMRPLQWLASFCVAALVAAIKYNAATWVLICLVVLLVAVFGAFSYAYFYCLTSKKQDLRDELRTEHFAIQKSLIEKGYGDSLTGTLRFETPSNLLADPSQSSSIQIARAEDQK